MGLYALLINFWISFWIILFLLQAVICAFLASTLAKHKGHDTTNWGFAGFLFGILGVIGAAGLNDKSQHTSKKLLKKCPDCAEMILIEAFVCKYCGKKFDK